MPRTTRRARRARRKRTLRGVGRNSAPRSKWKPLGTNCRPPLLRDAAALPIRSIRRALRRGVASRATWLHEVDRGARGRAAQFPPCVGGSSDLSKILERCRLEAGCARRVAAPEISSLVTALTDQGFHRPSGPVSSCDCVRQTCLSDRCYSRCTVSRGQYRTDHVTVRARRRAHRHGSDALPEKSGRGWEPLPGACGFPWL